MRHLPLVLIVLVACSRSGEPAESIPSATDLVQSSTTTALQSTTTTVRLSIEEAALQFSACMREEGLEFPDIAIGSDGRPVLGDLAERVDITSPEFLAALSGCSEILTAAGATDLRSDPEFQGIIQDQLQEFSDCMRTEGVDEFPDPIASFTGGGSPYPLAEIPFSDPDFQSALGTCQEHVAFPGLGG